MKQIIITLFIFVLCGGLLMWRLIYVFTQYELIATIKWKSGVKTEAGPFEIMDDFEFWRESMFKDDTEKKIKEIDYFYRKKSKS